MEIFCFFGWVELHANGRQENRLPLATGRSSDCLSNSTLIHRWNPWIWTVFASLPALKRDIYWIYNLKSLYRCPNITAHCHEGQGIKYARSCYVQDKLMVLHSAYQCSWFQPNGKLVRLQFNLIKSHTQKN